MGQALWPMPRQRTQLTHEPADTALPKVVDHVTAAVLVHIHGGSAANTGHNHNAVAANLVHLQHLHVHKGSATHVLSHSQGRRCNVVHSVKGSVNAG